MEKYRRYHGRGPGRTGSALVRDALTGRPLFVMCFYDNPLSMGSVVMWTRKEEPPKDMIMSGGDMIRRALKKRGLNPDNYAVSVFETSNTSFV